MPNAHEGLFQFRKSFDYQRRTSTCAQENHPAPISRAMDGNSRATAIKVGKGLIIGVIPSIDQRRRMREPAGFAGCHHKAVGQQAAIPVLGDILRAWIKAALVAAISPSRLKTDMNPGGLRRACDLLREAVGVASEPFD
jgi:hypothetical protein